MPLIDLHIHSDFSADGQSRIEDYCKKAGTLGISEIGFAEHIDFNPVDLGYGKYDYEKNSAEMLRVKKIFRNNPKIRFGAEITYEKKFEDDIHSYLKGKVFEYLVGSDCHSAESLGAGIREAIAIAKNAGFEKIVSFEKGEAVLIEI